MAEINVLTGQPVQSEIVWCPDCGDRPLVPGRMCLCRAMPVLCEACGRREARRESGLCRACQGIGEHEAQRAQRMRSGRALQSYVAEAFAAFAALDRATGLYTEWWQRPDGTVIRRRDILGYWRVLQRDYGIVVGLPKRDVARQAQEEAR